MSMATIKLFRYRVIQSGFTLVELMLATLLMSGLLLVIGGAFTTALSVQTESSAEAAVTEDGNYILARLSYDIMRTDTITAPAALGATSATLSMTTSGVSNTFSLNAGNLRLVSGANTDNLNGAGTAISGLTFQRLGNAGGKETIRLNFTVTSRGLSNQVTVNKVFTSTVGRR